MVYIKGYPHVYNCKSSWDLSLLLKKSLGYPFISVATNLSLHSLQG